MSNRKEVLVKYIDYNGTMDFDDPYFRHKTQNNYFFYDEKNKIKYRWTTKNDVAFIKENEYKIQFRIINERGLSNEVVIGNLKIYEYIENSYGEYNWIEVNQHKYDNWH